MGSDLLQEWLDKGNNELRSAEYLSTMHYPTPDEVICYLCQQATEKYLKAYIFSKGIEPEKTHDLELLLEECKKHCTEFPVKNTDVFTLNKYGVMPRYPNQLEITSENMKKAITDAKMIKELVLKILSVGE